MQDKLESLEAENGEKQNLILAADTANLDLERRLEFMSELVATSPTKLDLCQQDPMDRRRSPTRPLSLITPNSRVSPSRHSKRFSRSALDTELSQRARSPESPTSDRRRRATRGERSHSGTSEEGSSGEMVSLSSEGTILRKPNQYTRGGCGPYLHVAGTTAATVPHASKTEPSACPNRCRSQAATNATDATLPWRSCWTSVVDFARDLFWRQSADISTDLLAAHAIAG